MTTCRCLKRRLKQIDGPLTAEDMTQEQLEELAKERKLAEENCREEFARFKSDPHRRHRLEPPSQRRPR